MIWRFLLLIILCSGGLCSQARAQFFLEEGKVSLKVSPGEQVARSLAIHNTTNEPVKVRVYWEDFEYQPPYNSDKEFMAGGLSERSASNMVVFSPREFEMPAFSSWKVDYKVTVPDDFSGGRYGVLFFEKAGDPYVDATGVNIVTRVGCLFFVESVDRKKTADLQNLAVSGDNLTGVFVNQGDVILIPKISYYFMDGQGMVLDRGELPRLYVPAGKSADWTLPLPKELSSGPASLALNVDMDEGAVIFKEIELAHSGEGSIIIGKVQD